MKIYFNAAISSKSEYGEYYKRIVKKLQQLGHEVYAEHILDVDLVKVLSKSSGEHQRYYNNMVARITRCDLMVAEVSFPSTVNVGHELSLAVERGKPVLALHVRGKKPVLFWGLESDKFFVSEYDEHDLESVIERAMEELKNQTETRFNFFVSRDLSAYLAWISRKRRIPRAVYLRQLIWLEMKKNREFQL